jgi:hypothetical protein
MYRIDFNDFFTSAFSVDCILFGYSEGEIKALLIKRANHLKISGRFRVI